MSDRVPAFVLRLRTWVYLQLGHERKGETIRPFLTEITPNYEAWNDLQLPGADSSEGHKCIIQSLVDKHFAKDMDFDLVRDKGREFIILLYGAPGVSKTSTAECVAEAKGNPLLPITCGDLGLNPEQVEANLTRHFELAQAWDCILLLDEADVYPVFSDGFRAIRSRRLYKSHAKKFREEGNLFVKGGAICLTLPRSNNFKKNGNLKRI